MKKVYFYNYDAIKVDVYNKFNHGTFWVEGEGDFDPHKHVMELAENTWPDADKINVIALNRID